MTMQVERFVATFALACLCNCATTKPDSTDSPSSLIDLPEQQKQNDDKLTIDGGGGETGETISGTGSQHNLDPDGIPLDQSPTTVSELTDSGENQSKDPSVSDQLKGHQRKTTPFDPNPSSTTELNEVTLPFATQTEASNPTADGKHSFDSENVTDPDGIEDGKKKSLEGDSNDESDTSLADILIKDSTEDLDPLEVGQGEGNPSGVSKTAEQTTLDQTDLKFSGTRVDPENKTPSPDATVGLSAHDHSPLDEPNSPENRLVYESENQPESPSSTSPTSNLGFSDSNSESPDLAGVNSASLFFSEPHANGTNLGSDKSTSIYLGPQKDAPSTGPTKSARRYVGLSQWLSRSSSKTSSRDEVYLGHSEPKVPVELESYIDESPLVGIDESVPWEYDSIVRLLRPRKGWTSGSSDETGFDYESVRNFFGRKRSMETTETNVNATATAFRYDGVLHWLDRRDSASIPPKAKPPAARKYSNALKWIRNEGR
ncbi:hypothetical protein N9D63_06940 [Opitutales bacterium]|jgi:hypothetical protein|nr:hypothetical protein [Opitutales bacterium]